MPRLCSALPLRLCTFLVKATPGCCRRRNILYHFFFRVVLAGCMKALYFWMLRSHHGLGSPVAGAVSPQNLPGFPGKASQAVFPLGSRPGFLPPARSTLGAAGTGCGLEGPVLWAQGWGCPSCWSGASPAKQKWTGAARWLHVGPVRVQQDIQAQLLSWGTAGGGQADGLGLGAGPWRLEGVLGQGFQLTGCSVSVGSGPPGLVFSWVVRWGALCPPPSLQSAARPSPSPLLPQQRAGKLWAFPEGSHSLITV